VSADQRPRQSRRLGRPAAADSARRRSDIIAAARSRFADSGYAATTLSAVAQDAGITLSALYHYFEEKSALFEAVFYETIEDTWGQIRAALDGVAPEARGPIALIEVILSASGGIEPAAIMFLTTAPLEIARHPELGHLLEHREKVQEAQIRAVIGPAFRSGRLAGFPDLETAVVATRIVMMGWGLENLVREADRERLLSAARAIFEQFDYGNRPHCEDPA
jgi:AcrR family transcriptional regulator